MYIRVCTHVYVSIHLNTYNRQCSCKCVYVGRNEDKLEAVDALSRHAGVRPAIMCQD